MLWTLCFTNLQSQWNSAPEEAHRQDLHTAASLSPSPTDALPLAHACKYTLCQICTLPSTMCLGLRFNILWLCLCRDWLRPDYKCYWPGDMSPWKTTVGSVFGRGAQKKYGNKTLAGGLLTGDELLRQAIAALLNSRTNEHFYMSPRGIKSKFSKALYGSWKEKSTQAKAFKDANDGYGRGTCLLVSCKW